MGKPSSSRAALGRSLACSAACLVAVALGCASAPTPAAEGAAASPVRPERAEESAPAASSAPEPAAAFSRELLIGEWAEFWAVAGRAETQRYLFAADGSFVWRPAPTEADAGASRAGHWELDGDTLLLSHDGDAAFGATPPAAERLALGDCPPNEEAEQLDASYRCLSIGNRAFWRRTAQ